MAMMAKVMTMTYIMTMFTIIDDQDDDYEYMIINIAQGYGNNCELDHLQEIDMSKGVHKDSEYNIMIKMMIMVMVILIFIQGYFS